VKQVLLRILGDFLATIAFIVVYYSTKDIVFATGFAIALGLAQIVYLAVRKLEITAMQWMSLALVVVLGGLTMITANATFIMLKASIAHFAIATVMLKRGWQLPYMPPIVSTHVPERVLVLWGYAWSATMATMGAANVGAAFTMNMDQWTIFISALGFAKFGLLSAQFLDLRNRIARSIRAARAAEAETPAPQS
jgi:intracellular septation protein